MTGSSQERRDGVQEVGLPLVAQHVVLQSTVSGKIEGRFGRGGWPSGEEPDQKSHAHRSSCSLSEQWCFCPATFSSNNSRKSDFPSLPNPDYSVEGAEVGAAVSARAHTRIAATRNTSDSSTVSYCSRPPIVDSWFWCQPESPTRPPDHQTIEPTSGCNGV